MIEAIPFEEYLQRDGLSFHGLLDLAVSPLQYWHKHVRPDRESEEPTAFKEFGTAVHTAVLEPSRFASEYARDLDPTEYGAYLDTIDEIRQWIREHGGEPRGTKKDDVIAIAKKIDPDVLILSSLKKEHAEKNAGRKILKVDEYDRVAACADSALSERRVRELLDGAEIEQSYFAVDDKTNVLLKGRLDIVKRLSSPGRVPRGIIGDLKTFSIRADKQIDQAVADAIWYQRYYWQAFHYCRLCGWPNWDGSVQMVFIQSEPPHEVRIKSLAPTTHGQANLYFDRARSETRQLIELYAHCRDTYGTAPWRAEAEVDPLVDEEIKGLAFS